MTILLAMSAPSERFEILAMFPLGDFQIEAVDLRLLELAEVIDERAAQAFAQAFVSGECIERVAQGARQRFGLRFIGRIRGRRQFELASYAVETGDHLRCEIQ